MSVRTANPENIRGTSKWRTARESRRKRRSTYCQANTFVSGTKVFVNLNDQDFFKLFCHAVQYIQAWELAVAPAYIRQARKQIEENMQNNQ